MNLVYWSDEEVNVALTSANGATDVFYIPSKDIDTPKGKNLRERFFNQQVFYFSQVIQQGLLVTYFSLILWVTYYVRDEEFICFIIGYCFRRTMLRIRNSLSLRRLLNNSR